MNCWWSGGYERLAKNVRLQIILKGQKNDKFDAFQDEMLPQNVMPKEEVASNCIQ